MFDSMAAKGYSVVALYSDWRYWTYNEWNERLVAYCFAQETRTGSAVERIPATPEELAQVIHDPAADPHEVTEAFVSCVREQLRPNAVSFCGFCRRYGSWSPKASAPPHFFAMLWLTCLVAYGYPDTEGGFHERITRLLGRGLNLDCLPELWADLAAWTRNAALSHGGKARNPLQLPPPDDYRSTIGQSWFLAFPHRNDRLKLRRLLEENDLVGDEPPIGPVVDLLNRDRETFGESFREDMKNFVTKFLHTGEDARNSAFWRAVRQEAIQTGTSTSELNDLGELNLMAYLEDDEMVLYLGCDDETLLPMGFSKQPLRSRIGNISNYVIRDTDDSVASGMEEAVAAILAEGIYVPRVTRHVRRGVLVFKEELSNEYKLVGGSDANEASVALVSGARIDAFVRAYGGEAYRSRFPRWHEVIDCEVVVRRDLPLGLEGVLHLQETMFPPVARFIGGIRMGQDFQLMPGFMPIIKFKGSRLVELFNSSGTKVDALTRAAPDGSEWEFRDELTNLKADRYTVRVLWLGDGGVERTTETDLTLVEGRREQVRPEYKGAGAGRYYIESCTPGEIQVSGDDILPLGILGGELAEGGPDLVELDPELRYLGAGCGEFSRIRRPGFDWLVTGPKKNPDVLLFVGNPDSPQSPLNRRSEVAGERRHWRLAMNESRRVAARLQDGRIVPIQALPKVHEAFMQYKRHNPSVGASVFRNEGWFDEHSLWRGEEPDSRVAGFIDALAAISVRRSGISFKVLVDLLAAMSGKNIGIAPAFIFDIARAWMESGAFDIAYSQGRRATYVVPRRPFFVAFRVATYIHAALIGLTPSTLRAYVERAAMARGCDYDELLPTCRWLPKILRLKCDDPEVLKNISEATGLAPPRWLKWPIDAALDLRPDDQGLRDGSPHDFFFTVKVWDWSKGRFVRVESLSPSSQQESGVSVDLRSHRERCSVYSVSFEGTAWGWTHIRNWALLFAYVLKDGHSPLTMFAKGPIRRPGDIGVYLPLPVGRLCSVLGEGLAGPMLGQDGVSVQEYLYPLGRTYLEKLSRLLPVHHDNRPEIHA
jgi:hypothetical protein